MEGRFARAQARLHRVGSSRLADSIGSYQEQGVTVGTNLQLQVDKEHGFVGAAEAFEAGVVFVTWHLRELSDVSRGGLFTTDTAVYLVEKVIANDGHMATAACMVQP